MNIIGRQEEIGIGVESVRGTPTTASRWFKKLTASILPRAEKAVDESSMGVLEDSQGARITKKWSDGDIEGYLHADMIGYILLNLYGSVDSSIVASGVYSHEFTLEQSLEHASLSIFRKDGDIISEKYGGGVVNTLELSAKAGEYIKAVVNIILGTSATSTEVPTYGTEYDFIGRDISIKIADTEAGLTGATAMTVKGFSLKINANAITDHKFGSYNPDIYNSALGIELEVMKNFEDSTFEALYKANTYKYVQIKIEGEADLGSGNKPTLTMLLNKAQITNWDRSADANALSEETVTFKAFYNATDTQASSIVLQNKTVSYAIGS
ncbi:MAG: phage tail tube protein [Patescibacteria group bacterium]